MDANEYRLLGLDEVDLEAPDACLELWPFEELKAYGDRTGDDFKTMSNLIHQLHYLHRVVEMAERWKPDLYVFCRPDLEYHDSFGPCLARALAGPEACHVPYWQWRGGLNDRFAVIRGAEIAARYSGRIQQILPYCERTGRSLHAETLLRFAIGVVPVRLFSVRLPCAGHRDHQVRELPAQWL